MFEWLDNNNSELVGSSSEVFLLIELILCTQPEERGYPRCDIVRSHAPTAPAGPFACPKTSKDDTI